MHRKHEKVTFRISTAVGENRQVILQLPSEAPIGQVELEVSVSVPTPKDGKPARTSLADWADQRAEHWGDRLQSTDVEGFTGRRF